MSELRLNTDGHIIKFGADNDVSLTHVADTGLLLNSTMQLQFNDASQNINAPSATVLDINATDEIELNSTAVDLNGTLDVSGTLTQTGVATFTARSVHSSGITIANAGQIGSVGDADSMAIASNGVVTFTQAPVFPDGSLAVADLDIDGATDIGAAVVDADLFIIDDGAGGTNRKVTASRIKTYAGGAAVMNDLTDVIMDITNYVDGILIQTGSNGSAPTTGTLNGASNDIGIGHDVFKALTSGANNIAIGGLAADGLTTGDANIAIGYGALSGAVTGDDNVAIGRSAGIALTGGTLNVIVGQGAGLGVIGGARNVLVGATAGDDITGGNDNIAIGHNTCQNSDDEDQNIAIGSDALGSTGDIDGGESNIAIGTNAAQDLTTGDNNVVIGDNGGHNITTGNHNVLIGGEAGNTTTTEASNVAIGYNAGKTNIGSNSVYLGRDCVGAGNDHEIVIGFSAVTAGADTLAFGRASNIVSNNYATNASFARSSDLHKKTNIENDTLGLNFINNLRTVKFNWKPNSEFPKHYNDYDAKENHMVTDVRMHGMIAQEVKEALDIEGVDTFGGWSEDEDGSQRISQEMFVHPLIKAVQELSEENKNLKDRLTILENK